ncbi:MAG: hypothetical protein E7158_00710 [Firmicutes bacterium]|nr:hypothetical protein [Bacillota bacterium]
MIKIVKYRKIIAFFLVVVSILLGILTFCKLKNGNIEFIKNNFTKINYFNYKIIIFHFIILTISFFLSFIGIGLFILLFYLLYELFTIGFMFSYFAYFYKTKGILFNFTYFLIYKFILLFLLVILILKYYKLFKNFFKYIRKENVDITKTVVNSQLINIFILFHDIILILFGKYLLNLFTFLLK